MLKVQSTDPEQYFDYAEDGCLEFLPELRHLHIMTTDGDPSADVAGFLKDFVTRHESPDREVDPLESLIVSFTYYNWDKSTFREAVPDFRVLKNWRDKQCPSSRLKEIVDYGYAEYDD